jgi:hypothetical protein
MAQAITTRYADPHGSAIVATTANGQQHTINYPDELSFEAAHRKAAEGLRDKMGWEGKLIGGITKRGYAFVINGGDAR